jgi:hypothetical protein
LLCELSMHALIFLSSVRPTRCIFVCIFLQITLFLDVSGSWGGGWLVRGRALDGGPQAHGGVGRQVGGEEGGGAAREQQRPPDQPHCRRRQGRFT